MKNYVIGLLLLLIATSVFAQYPYVHYEHPLSEGWVADWQEDQWVVDMATSNVGSFIVGRSGEKLRLVDNHGFQVGTTNSISSTHGLKNIAVATNHLSQVAIINVLEDGTSHHRTQLGVRIIGNDPTLGQLNMNTETIMTSVLPNYAITHTFQNGPTDDFASISHVEARMDDKRIYITWCQSGGAGAACTCGIPGVTHYGYAVLDIASRNWVFVPNLIPDPNGVPAEGISAPSVACNRWDESTDKCRMAFSYIDVLDPALRKKAAYFNPFVNATQSQVLLEPNNTLQGNNAQDQCYWVRVVNYDEPDGNSGYHYFYAWYFPIPNQPSINLTLFSTDNTTTSGIITDLLPSYPPFDDDVYPMPAVGNGYTEKSVYLTYWTDDTKRQSSTTPRPKQNLSICTQWGKTNFGAPTNPHQIYPDFNFNAGTQAWNGPNLINPQHPEYGYEQTYLDVTLGCNQTGILVCYTVTNPTGQYTHLPYFWRADRPLASPVRENTVLTDENEITQSLWHPFTGQTTTNVTIGPSVLTTSKADTVRLLHTLRINPGNDLNSYFRYSAKSYLTFKKSSNPQMAMMPMALIAGRGTTHDGNRAYIILDGQIQPNGWGQGVIVDFNEVVGAGIGAIYNGGFEYNGASLDHMSYNNIMLFGDQNTTDTIEKYRALGYFNAPCTITGGSQLFSNMGQIRFKAASTQADMAIFSTTGFIGSSISITNSTMFLGGRNTTQNLKQISVNSSAIYDPATPHNIHITNSLVSSGEGHIFYYELPAGYCSTIEVNAPGQATFIGNLFKTTYIDIKNPLDVVMYNSNKSYEIRKHLRLTWAPLLDQNYPEHFVGSVSINDNFVTANLPIGNHDWQEEAIDYQVTGFVDKDPITDAPQVDISRNVVGGNTTTSTVPFQSNWTAIVIDKATNANVTNNTISNVGTGIYQEALKISTAFICSNTIFATGCATPNGIGIRQNEGRGVSVLNNVHFLDKGFYFENNDRTSVVHNYINRNKYGAVFTDYTETHLDGLHTANSTYAGMNVFDNNEDVSQSQIFLDNSGTVPQYPKPVIGHPVSSSTNKFAWANNKFTITGSRVHIQSAETGSSNLDWNGTLSLNEWDDGSNNQILTGSGKIGSYANPLPEPKISHVWYFNTENVTASISDIACTGSYTLPEDKGGQPLAYSGNINNELSPNPEEEDSLYLYYRGMYWYGTHTRKGLDTLRLYVERHPYATKSPGMVLTAMSSTVDFTADLHGGATKDDWIIEYNWLAMVQTLNTEASFQSQVISDLASTLYSFDRNEAANMWYNYSLIFTDSVPVAYAWNHIKSIREYQKLIPEDSTPFHKLTFPLKPKAGVKPQRHVTLPTLEMSLFPNPSATSSMLNIELPRSEYLTISLYDLLGRRLRTIASDLFEAGGHSINLNTRDLSAGSYYVRLEYSSGVLTKKLIVQQ